MTDTPLLRLARIVAATVDVDTNLNDLAGTAKQLVRDLEAAPPPEPARRTITAEQFRDLADRCQRLRDRKTGVPAAVAHILDSLGLDAPRHGRGRAPPMAPVMTDFAYIESRFAEVEARIRYHARLTAFTLGVLLLLLLLSLIGLTEHDRQQRQRANELREALREQEELLEQIRDRGRAI